MTTLVRLLRGILTGRAEPREWEVAMVYTAQQAAAAGMAAVRKVPLEFSAVVGSKTVNLRQVPLDGSQLPEPVRGTTFCLDIHENENALSAAIEYVKRARAVEPGSVLRFTPSIFALVNISVLVPEQLGRVNNELIPAGASIYEYPKACGSFAEAMHALFEEVKESRRAYAEEHERKSYFSGLMDRVRQTLVGATSAGSSAKTVGQGGSSGSIEASAAK